VSNLAFEQRGDNKASQVTTKDTQVLNANATKFKVLSHTSEREKQSEAYISRCRESLKGWFPLRFGLDTTLDCIELIKEMIQYRGHYIYYGADSE